MKWKVLDKGACSAEANMSRDAKLLDGIASSSEAILHFYEWEAESATYGYFAKPEILLNLAALRAQNIQLARRPTGGGVLFHFTDLAFSALIPAGHAMYSTNTLQNYAAINQVVERAVCDFIGTKPLLLENEPLINSSARHFCMGKPTQFDVMLGEKKVAGAAQRRTKAGLLHQGSIHLALPAWDQLACLIKDESIIDSMRQYSVGLVESGQLLHARKEMKALLIKKFSEA